MMIIVIIIIVIYGYIVQDWCASPKGHARINTSVEKPTLGAFNFAPRNISLSFLN